MGKLRDGQGGKDGLHGYFPVASQFCRTTEVKCIPHLFLSALSSQHGKEPCGGAGRPCHPEPCQDLSCPAEGAPDTASRLAAQAPPHSGPRPPSLRPHSDPAPDPVQAPPTPSRAGAPGPAYCCCCSALFVMELAPRVCLLSLPLLLLLGLSAGRFGHRMSQGPVPSFLPRDERLLVRLCL